MMKQIFKQRGFTLIELLVVIAIIGILASVVLASLNSARDKGADAAAKSSLNNMRAQAELEYDENSNSYAAVCTNEQVVQGIAAAQNATGNTVTCVDVADAWGMEVELKSGEFYCVDNTGQSTTTAASTSLADANPECD